MEMRYSPQGDLLALGCRDHLVHLLSVHNGYKHAAVLRGHSAFVRSIDFSTDGALVQTSDAAREIMFWDAKGQRVLNAAHFRDVIWESASSVYGYNAQGVFNNSDAVPAVDGDINCVDRSPDGEWLVSGGSNTVHHAIKLFNYPCLPDAIPSFHGGHTSPVLDVKVLDTAEGTTEVATAGGNDSCVFQWRLLEYGTPRRK
jgi:WD40 repeat protein